jgi:glycosyltransferase involved in cell wall biosynthesis
MNIYYWSPFLSHVATVNAVIASASSIKKYSKKKINTFIINSFGEWTPHEKELKKKNIEIINFFSNDYYYLKLPRNGYFKSRFSYLIVIFVSFFKLHKFLKSRNDKDVFISHLLVSAPMILSLIFCYRCTFILRISGFPKLNFFRKTLWKIAGSNLKFITCPTVATKSDLIKKKFFNKEKIILVRDPILMDSKIDNFKSKIVNFKYCLAIGRLTAQKNFSFLIKSFDRILKIDPDLNLIILGEGEEFENLKLLIKKKN